MASDTQAAAIRFDRVSKVFADQTGSLRALRDVSLEVCRGETVCLIGPSGAGKTTALRMVNALERPTDGEVWVEGQPVASRALIGLRRSIGYVTQQGGLFPHLNVARNIGLLCEIEGWGTQRRQQRVDELLQLVNLAPQQYRHRQPSQLSGGEQQRVAIARAIALDPTIVLMDEPFSALDPLTRSRLQNELIDIAKRLNRTMVIVTHDLAEAFKLGDRIAVFCDGTLLQCGSQQELLTKPANAFVEQFVAQAGS